MVNTLDSQARTPGSVQPSATAGPGTKNQSGTPEDVGLRWFTMDLHLHTPASSDYQQPAVNYVEILRQADTRELDIVAFTDHNSVRGYAELWREIEDLELLEFLGRLNAEETARLTEYRSLLDRILLLPGFEFTATFGFHILAIFPEQTTIRMMEHLLLLLGVSEQRFGSGEVGSTTEVLRAYDILSSHGAIVIGAHVNSANGIAMQGIRFGGQTKIAYTQDPNLHALEMTDLAVQGTRRTTANFFNGTKSEYPRRMHAIQGSDAHRLERDPDRPTYLGVGDRATDVRLPEITFAALKALFTSEHFDRTRPHVNRDDPFEIVRSARADGNTDRQAFHESLANKRIGASNVVRDVVAFANTEGGTVYIGASPSERRPVAGVADPKATTAEVLAALEESIAPQIELSLQTLPVGSKHVIAVQVPSGPEKPYAQTGGGIVVRRGDESVPASRDEIVAMVRGTPISTTAPTRTPEPQRQPAVPPAPQPQERTAVATVKPEPTSTAAESNGVASSSEPAPPAPNDRRRRRRSNESRADRDHVGDDPVVPEVTSGDKPMDPVQSDEATITEYVEDAAPDPAAPRIGVEVVAQRLMDGESIFTMRDLRNGTLTHNVTPTTKGRLWRYAIQEHQHRPVDPATVRWRGDHGYVRAYRPRGEKTRHNLALRGNGTMRIFYGVTEEGMSDAWKATLPSKST